MKNNETPEEITKKINEVLMQEITVKNSEINKYLENQALNLILTKLSLQRRLEFYQLLGNNDFGSAKDLVLKNISDFYEQLLTKVKNNFQKSYDKKHQRRI
jgi:hypothetical protein